MSDSRQATTAAISGTWPEWLIGILVGTGEAALLLVTLGRLAHSAALEPHLVRDRIGPRVHS